LERLPTSVSDIMSRPVGTIDKMSKVQDAAQLMTENRIGSIIITENRKPVGIITEQDMLERVVAPGRDPSITETGEIMSSPLLTINKEKGILEAMREMREHDISRLVVMDEETMVGIVSEKDVIRAVSIASLTSFSSLLRRS
jgi:predicted transcriptional regulator